MHMKVAHAQVRRPERSETLGLTPMTLDFPSPFPLLPSTTARCFTSRTHPTSPCLKGRAQGISGRLRLETLFPFHLTQVWLSQRRVHSQKSVLYSQHHPANQPTVNQLHCSTHPQSLCHLLSEKRALSVRPYFKHRGLHKPN